MRPSEGHLAAEAEGHRAPFQEIHVRAHVDTDAKARQFGQAESSAVGQRNDVVRERWKRAVEIDDKRAETRRRLLSARTRAERQTPNERERRAGELFHGTGGIVA